MRIRLDEALASRNLTQSRSRAADLIKRGKVKVDGQVVIKPSWHVDESTAIEVTQDEQFVSRAALKLKAATDFFDIDFKNKVMLDVGISTGGFTELALTRGAKKVVGVEVGTNQLHESLQGDSRIELHEKTDIRDYTKPGSMKFDIITIDVSFISMREVLPHILTLADSSTQIIAMLKPQFEVGDGKKHKGVVKNDTMRRKIIKEFEDWLRDKAFVVDKKDSQISGKKGNVERFYLLKLLQ